MSAVECPGCGRPLGDSYEQQQHEPTCPAVYEPGSPAFHELTERKIDRLLGSYPADES